jgi:hypothetical protein
LEEAEVVVLKLPEEPEERMAEAPEEVAVQLEVQPRITLEVVVGHEVTLQQTKLVLVIRE